MYILIDGQNIAFRSYYVHKNLSSKHKGKVYKTGVLYGFLDILLTAISKSKLENEEKKVYVVWDRGRNRRTAIYPDYKGDRDKRKEEDPKVSKEYEDVNKQSELLKKVLPIMGINQIYMKGEEADDVIGSFAKQKSSKGQKVMIISGDHDFFQLIDDNIVLYLARKSGNEIYDVSRYKEEFGIMPHEYVDVMSISGDGSDNIKGVTGFGEKTAFDTIKKNPKLVQQIVFENNNSPEIIGLTEKKKQTILDSLDIIKLTNKLVTIETGLREYKFKKQNKDLKKLEYLFEVLKFFSILKDEKKWGMIKNVSL